MISFFHCDVVGKADASPLDMLLLILLASVFDVRNEQLSLLIAHIHKLLVQFNGSLEVRFCC